MSGVPAVAAAAAHPPPMVKLPLQTTPTTAASASSSSFTLIVDAVVLFIRSLQLRPANIDPEEVKKACVQVVALAKDVRDSPTVDEKTKMAINKIASILGKAVADFLSALARLQQTLRASNGGNQGEELKAQTEQVEEKKEQLARAVGLLLRVLGVNSKAQDLVRSHSYSLIMEKCSKHQQPSDNKKTNEKAENGEKKGEEKEEDDEEQNDSNNVEAMRLQVRMLEEELRHVREEMQSYRQSVMLMKAEDVTKEEKSKAKKQAKSKKKSKAKRHVISHSATASPRYHSSSNKHGEDLLTVNWNTISPRSLFHKERKTKKKEKGEAAGEETATTTKEDEGETAEEKKQPKKKHQKDERSGKYIYGFAEEGEDEEEESGDEADVNTFWKAKEEELRRREEVLNRKNEELLKRRRQKWSLRKLKKATKTEEKKSKSRKSSFNREKNHSNSNSNNNQQQTDLWTPSNSLKEDNRTKDGEEVDEQKEWKEELRNKQEQQELALKLHLMIRETTTTTQREETGEGEDDEEEEQRWRETMARKQQEQEAKEAELKEKEKTLQRTIRERDKAIARLKREEERRAKERALQQREVELQKREEELTRKMLEEEERAEREYQALLQRLSRLGKQNTWPQDTSDIQDFLLEREQEQQTTKEKEKEGQKEEEKRRGRKDSSAAKEAERRALKKVLRVPHSRALLFRYLRDSPTLFSEDNLMFWEAVEAFRASSLSQGMEGQDYEGKEAIRDVLVKHLSSAGLQIRSELRAHLLQRLSSPEAEQETDSFWSFFDEAQEAVELSLQTSVIGGFLQSDLWKDYLQRGGPPLGADGSLLSIEKVLNRLKDSNYGLLARLRSASSSSSSAAAFTGRDLIDWFMEHVHLGGREEARALAERMLDLGYLQQTEYKFVQQVSDTEAPPHYFFDPNLRSIKEMINNKSGGNAIVTEEEFHRLLAHMLGLEPEHEEYLGNFLRETIGGDDTTTAAQLFSEWRVEDEFQSFKAFLTKHSRKIQRYIQQSLNGSERVEVEDDATKNYLDQVLVLVMKHIMFVGSTKSDATARNLHLLYRRNSNRDNKK